MLSKQSSNVSKMPASFHSYDLGSKALQMDPLMKFGCLQTLLISRIPHGWPLLRNKQSLKCYSKMDATISLKQPTLPSLAAQSLNTLAPLNSMNAQNRSSKANLTSSLSLMTSNSVQSSQPWLTLTQPTQSKLAATSLSKSSKKASHSSKRAQHQVPKAYTMVSGKLLSKTMMHSNCTPSW